ncbi:NTP transferase domain-containing protein [Niveispirillum sp. BGYR6]|uniref:NTP transferase domain-containing protein n=1 Tax=Niveispirillum sp. BGYR6 TaxID=2971249 RepID=UPI0022B99D6B|nr:NTP transferase domain-containing protein [Niveispirillum sp. BGYR6]MDG5494362.1 NTP transferase domain-containing protein [Niveispirillum sp. BGYR6]
MVDFSGVTTLVLAGSRGPEDPVAKLGGVSHKAFVPVAGVPMLLRVVRALLASPSIGTIHVAIERPDLVQADTELAPLLASGRLRLLPAEGSPSRSVSAALDALGTPLFVTTADHALLRPEWVEHFLTHLPDGSDVCAALARDQTVMAAVPDTQRTYLRFADGAFSGCNMFAFRTPQAAGIARLWRQVEAQRKNPLRMIRLLGPWSILRFLLGRLTITAALARLGKLAGARAAIVEMPFGMAAVDVDKAADLELAERLLTHG